MDEDRYKALQRAKNDPNGTAETRGMAYAELRGYRSAITDQMLALLRAPGFWHFEIMDALEARLAEVHPRERARMIAQFQDFFTMLDDELEDAK